MALALSSRLFIQSLLSSPPPSSSSLLFHFLLLSSRIAFHDRNNHPHPFAENNSNPTPSGTTLAKDWQNEDCDDMRGVFLKPQRNPKINEV